MGDERESGNRAYIFSGKAFGTSAGRNDCKKWLHCKEVYSREPLAELLRQASQTIKAFRPSSAVANREAEWLEMALRNSEV
jgi:hypothetical protein